MKSSHHCQRGEFPSSVLANECLCTDHYRLTLSVAGFPAATPGQFVQLDCRDPESSPAQPMSFVERTWSPAGLSAPMADTDLLKATAYLRRPFSIARCESVGQDRRELELIYRVVGRGTHYLAGLRAGETISVLGPLGHGFTVGPQVKEALLVGGGVGVPPMIFLAKMLAEAGIKAVAFLGAQRQDLFPVTIATDPQKRLELACPTQPGLGVMEFGRHGFGTVLSTDDGSLGCRGFVTQALEAYLMSGQRSGVEIYCCGPTPMMKATARVAKNAGVSCQVSLEQPMACGMGTCQSCVVKVGQPDAWSYKLTCTDGPVFPISQLLW